VVAAGSGHRPQPGPGDPTTLFLDGFGDACRLAFDAQGNLFANDGGVFYKVTPDGTKTLFTDQVPDPRGFAVDAFGNLLVASPRDSALYRVSPQAEVSVFAHAYNARGVAMDLDGSVWVTAVDTVHHFDAVGRFLEKFDIRSQGAAGFGIQISPGGEPHFSNFASLWRLSGGTPVPLLQGLPPRNRGFAFDENGNIYWARDAGEGDTDRVILYDASGEVLHDTIIGEVVDPCLITFLRDAEGVTGKRVLVSQSDGTIVEANAQGIPADGWPGTPLSLSDIAEGECADEAARVGGILDARVLHFLDVLGNNNRSYDVGDFRAYLLSTGAIQ
jgi:sugar lactone lactonase YvrE